MVRNNLIFYLAGDEAFDWGHEINPKIGQNNILYLTGDEAIEAHANLALARLLCFKFWPEMSNMKLWKFNIFNLAARNLFVLRGKAFYLCLYQLSAQPTVWRSQLNLPTSRVRVRIDTHPQTLRTTSTIWWWWLPLAVEWWEVLFILAGVIQETSWTLFRLQILQVPFLQVTLGRTMIVLGGAAHTWYLSLCDNYHVWCCLCIVQPSCLFCHLLKTDRDADLPENPVHLAAGHDRLLGKVTLELSSFSELSYLHVRICIYLHVLQYWQDKQYLAETPLCTGAPVALGVTLIRFYFFYFFKKD